MTAGLHTLVGAFALDALDLEERHEFEAHLDTCDGCSQEAAELSATAARLGSVAELQPSPAMRARVLDAVSRTPQHRPTVVSLQAHRSARRTPALLLAAAAVAAVLGIGVGVQQYQENQDLESAQIAAAREDAMIAEVLAAEDKVVRDARTDSGLQLTVVTTPQSDNAVVSMGRLPQLPEGRTYQVWRITGDKPDSAAVMATDDLSKPGVTMLIDAGDADAVAVTEEPAGGSERPTTDALVAVKLA
ncbi:MAG: hypothetical protein AVDCRST_MAG29-1793 [uncultured Nocardioidaceae bacterium]|uniref:Regulator of SigK n=1 Tax=uncultured Nocardioidaceae bacterium TaxID=253824 RepID=A0A6J4LXR7_9ACTN|nr:MAG: hypothetical protein AVDCRST_MAG29-1793 [uncultured Nocardioidaceae bacterium]